MLHPDYQYDATRIPALIAPIAAGERDLMLGSRFLGDPLAGGMPRWKYVSNRFLTGVENLAFGLHLSEYHTGLRAYSRRLLETIPYQLNSDDFVFDQELIAQVVAAGMAPPDRRDRRPDPLLRGGELGRLPAQRRLRPVDPAGRRPLPAPQAAAQAVAPAPSAPPPLNHEPPADCRGHVWSEPVSPTGRGRLGEVADLGEPYLSAVALVTTKPFWSVAAA